MKLEGFTNDSTHDGDFGPVTITNDVFRGRSTGRFTFLASQVGLNFLKKFYKEDKYTYIQRLE